MHGPQRSLGGKPRSSKTLARSVVETEERYVEDVLRDPPRPRYLPTINVHRLARDLLSACGRLWQPSYQFTRHGIHPPSSWPLGEQLARVVNHTLRSTRGAMHQEPKSWYVETWYPFFSTSLACGTTMNELKHAGVQTRYTIHPSRGFIIWHQRLL